MSHRKKATESDLLNCLTDPVALGICIVYDNLFLLECLETSESQRFCRLEVLPVKNT